MRFSHWWYCCFAAFLPRTVAGQATVVGDDTVAIQAGSGGARVRARSLQAAFERAREGSLQPTLGSGGGDCDEVIGRLCTWYGEGDWHAALEAARKCRRVSEWWCAALEGFALHGLHRCTEAELAFGRSLAVMDLEMAVSWRVPDMAVDPDARRILVGQGDAGE